jgi:hypothetical protein
MVGQYDSEIGQDFDPMSYSFFFASVIFVIRYWGLGLYRYGLCLVRHLHIN